MLNQGNPAGTKIVNREKLSFMSHKKRSALPARIMRAAYLAAQGVSPSEICERLKIKAGTYNAMARTVEFRSIYNELLQDLRLNSCADLATLFVKEGKATFRKVRQLRDQKSDLRVALGACKEILDRALPKIEQKETRTLTVHLSAEDTAQLKETMHGLTERLSGPLPIMQSSRESEVAALGGSPEHRATRLLPVETITVPPVPSLSLDDAVSEARKARLEEDAA